MGDREVGVAPADVRDHDRVLAASASNSAPAV